MQTALEKSIQLTHRQCRNSPAKGAGGHQWFGTNHLEQHGNRSFKGNVCGKAEERQESVTDIHLGDLQQCSRNTKLIADQSNLFRHARNVGVAQIASVQVRHEIQKAHWHDGVHL